MKKQQKFVFPLLILIVVLLVIVGPYIYRSKSIISPTRSQIIFSQLLNAQVPDIAYDPKIVVNLIDGEYVGPHLKGETGNDLGFSGTTTLETATTSYAYGDLNDDGLSDIAAIIVGDEGGSGSFEYLVAYIDDNGAPKLAASILIGDRDVINKVSIDKGIISLDIITQGPGEPMCCGTLKKTISYKLSGDSLVEITPTP